MPEGTNFDINKFLAEASRVHGTDAYNKLKKIFWENWKSNEFEKKYGFSPSVYITIANEIQKIGQKTYFKCLKDCLGKNHWALNFIKVGISISELSEMGKRKKTDEMREEILKKKGRKALRIATMGSTGAIRGIINYLDDLKRNDYTSESIREEFERIINDWEKMTIFVKKENEKIHIKNKIKQKMNEKPQMFFIFSYGFEANQIAMFSIAELNNEGILRSSRYLWDTCPKYDGVGRLCLKSAFCLKSLKSV